MLKHMALHVTSDLTMTNAGNRLQTVTNKGTEDKGTFSYAYDSSGNLTSDPHNRLEIQNNVLNLPMRVEQSTTGTSAGTMGGTMTYIYLGDGTRATARVGAASSRYAGKRYRGSFVYDVSAAGVQRLESIAVSTGRLIALTGTNGSISFESDGFITDHLGNKYFSMSQYNYCGNDQVNKSDPDGTYVKPSGEENNES